MGQYLSHPVTEKESDEGHNDALAFGVAAMQGWRVSMEDAHLTELQLDPATNTSLFSVFDGHGGKAVAKFCARHLPEEFLSSEAYKRGDLAASITEAYHRLDVLLDSEEGKGELREIIGMTTKKEPVGLFTEMEVQLSSDVGVAAGGAATAAAAGQPGPGAAGDAVPMEKVAEKAMKKMDSSKSFLQSHLMRASVITPLQSQDEEDQLLTNGTSGGGGVQGAAAEETSTSGSGQEEGSDEHRGEQPHAGGVGCTALSVVVRGLDVLVANTGDSRCVLSRKGQAIALTLDHKPILFEEARRIIKAGGFVRDNRINGALNVSRTIGDLDFKRNDQLEAGEQMVIATPDIEELQLQEGDEFAILACDGIWDVLSNQEAVDFVRKRIKADMSLKKICEEMCDHCLAPDLKGLCRGADNMSVTVVLFKKTARLTGFFGRLWQSVLCSFGAKT